MRTVIRNIAALLLMILSVLGSSEREAPPGEKTLDVINTLTYKPLGLGDLLGKRIENVLPIRRWRDLVMPPDYDSTNIGYKIFLRAKDLSNAMARWQFLINHNYCVLRIPTRVCLLFILTMDIYLT